MATFVGTGHQPAGDATAARPESTGVVAIVAGLRRRQRSRQVADGDDG